MQYRLKKDLVIPAGKVFVTAPKMTRRYAPHVCYILPVGDDCVAEIVVPVEPDNPDFADLFEET